MTTSQRIAAALLTLLTLAIGISPAAAETTETTTESTTTCSAETGSTDPEEMSDEELLDEAASETAAADQDAAAHDNTNDARERKSLRKSETDHRHRVAELKTAWRNNDGKKGTERSDEDFEAALGKAADPCFPMPEDPRDLPRW